MVRAAWVQVGRLMSLNTYFYLIIFFLHYVELKLKEGVGRRRAVGKGDSMNNRACFSCNHCIQPEIKFYILCQQ